MNIFFSNVGIKLTDLTCLSGPLGVCSVAIWIYGQLPQVYKNHRKKSVDGISPGFLLAWVLGDVASLLGCIITNQLLFQTLLSAYHCFIDVILVTQYMMYRTPTTIEFIDGCEVDNTNHIRRGSKDSVKSGIMTALRVSRIGNAIPGVMAAAVPFTNAAGDVSTESGPSKMMIFGQGLGYLSTLLFLVSRIPQIYHNYQRKSTTGISVILFLSAFLGNLTYSGSIFLSPECIGEGAHTREFLTNELSYLLGSMGTMLFDLVILGQRVYYKSDLHLRRRRSTGLDRLSRPYIRAKSFAVPVENKTDQPLLPRTPLLAGSPQSYGSLASSSCISSITSL